jgi:CPA2 family monovalent cation:H+ antiporter-2
MHADFNLFEIVIVITAALLGGIFFSYFRQPAILGYILAGIILGPAGFGFIQDRDSVSILAELGMLLLLFIVGMKLNLRTFKQVWLTATLCTILQITLCLSMTFGLSYFFDWSAGFCILLGFVMAISSTAVVVKILESINEYSTDNGQLTIGILIAQDLAIFPMILFFRSKNPTLLDAGLWFKMVLAIALLGGLINYLSRRQRLRIPLMERISSDKDLLPLVNLAICFSFALTAGKIGLSEAYGSFLAGLILGNSKERNHLLDTIMPIQSILMMTFCLSIGLLLDFDFLVKHLWTVLLLVFVIMFIKTALNIAILRLLRLPLPQATLIAVVLGQIGEFAFLLSGIAQSSEIINYFGRQLIITLTVFSLLFSPLWLWIVNYSKNFVMLTSEWRIIFSYLYDPAVNMRINNFSRKIRIFLRRSNFLGSPKKKQHLKIEEKK